MSATEISQLAQHSNWDEVNRRLKNRDGPLRSVSH